MQNNHAGEAAAAQNFQMTPERRASARDPLTLQFTLEDGSAAVTRDISAHGLYFFMAAGAHLEPWFAFDYTMPEAGLRFTAAGEVVRTEPAPDGQTGVAIRWHAPRLLPLH